MGKKIITVDLNFPSETQTVEDQEEVNDESPGTVDEYSAVKEEAASLGPPPALTSSLREAKPKRKPAPKKVEKVVEEPVIEAIEEPIKEPIEETVESVVVPTKDNLKKERLSILMLISKSKSISMSMIIFRKLNQSWKILLKVK